MVGFVKGLRLSLKKAKYYILEGESGHQRLHWPLDKVWEGNKKYKTIKVWYVIMDVNTSYNILLERTSLNKLV